jgi:fructose transport system permease protein
VQIVGILAAAQTLVILTKGIDLSVGAIMVLSSVVMGQFTFRYGMPVELAILFGLLCGALCGFINGWLVAKMKLPPFIVTLGMWQIVLATNFLYSKNETIRAQDIEAQAPLLQFFGNKFEPSAARSSPMASSSWSLLSSCWPTCCATRPGGGMSMPWATIPRRPSCRASR